jgi:hypothetical protein
MYSQHGAKANESQPNVRIYISLTKEDGSALRMHRREVLQQDIAPAFWSSTGHNATELELGIALNR